MKIITRLSPSHLFLCDVRSISRSATIFLLQNSKESPMLIFIIMGIEKYIIGPKAFFPSYLDDNNVSKNSLKKISDLYLKDANNTNNIC